MLFHKFDHLVILSLQKWTVVTKTRGRIHFKDCYVRRVADVLPFAMQAYCSERILIHGKCSGGTATSLS